MKIFYRYTLIFILFFFVSNTSQAIPSRSFQLIEKSSWTEMSRKQIEEQLGRKMSFKERIAFWLAKKKAKTKKGLSKFEKILFTIILILFLVVIVGFILIDNFLEKRDGIPRRAEPFIALGIDLGLIYYVLSRPTRKKEEKNGKEGFLIKRKNQKYTRHVIET